MSGPKPARRVSVDPLMTYTGAASYRDLCSMLGLSPAAVSGWVARGGLSVWRADEIATKQLDTHLVIVWPDAHDDITCHRS